MGIVGNHLQADIGSDLAEILAQVAQIVGLMEILRKHLKHAVVIRHIAALERIHHDKPPARFEDTGEFGKDGAADFRRQFVEEVD